MKICFITTNIFSLGGVQRVVSVLANKLSENHEIHILCTSKKGILDENIYKLNQSIKVEFNDELINTNIISKTLRKIIKEVNAEIGIFNNYKGLDILSKVYFPKKITSKFIKYLDDKNYDIIIGVEGLYSILLGVIKQDIKAKTIGWQHNSYDAYFKKYKKYHWNQDILFKRYLNELDAYIVLTDYDKKLIQNNFTINPIRIYNPLSFESKVKSDCNNKNIIFVGRLDEQQKGLDLLINVFKLVAENNEQWKLTIVGDGPDKEKLMDEINKLNLKDRINIKPFTNDIQRHYIESSIFLSTSRWEGFGLVITEAMECGLPVIAFKNSGPQEIISENGQNGILVEVEDVETMAEKVLYLINDKSYLLSLAQNSILRAKDFNIETIKNEWEKLILKITDIK